MRLTVLGSSASYPSAGRACAGHLVTEGDTAILLDVGNGVLSNLGKLMDPTRLAAVFISHTHIDHFADIYALQAALRYAPAGPLPPLPLYVPAGLFAHMQAALGEHSASELAEAFVVHDIVPGQTVQVGPVSVTAHPVEHEGIAFGFAVESGSAKLFYTSDTKRAPSVLDAARGASVLLAEATLPAEFEGRAPHMTPAEAGALATDAGARTLVLTHLWPSVDRAAAAVEASERFGGRVIVADELTQVQIES